MVSLTSRSCWPGVPSNPLPGSSFSTIAPATRLFTMEATTCLNMLDADTLRPRLAQTADLVALIQVTEMLPQYAAQSTALVCNDVPSEIGDFYRHLVLWHSSKAHCDGRIQRPNAAGDDRFADCRLWQFRSAQREAASGIRRLSFTAAELD